MKIIFKKEDLEKACNTVTSIANQQSPLSIIQCVLVESIDKDRIRFMASDLESSVRYETSAVIEEEGRIAVNAQKLSQIASKLVSGKDVILNVKDGKVKISSENADGEEITFNIPSRDAADFPDWPRINPVSIFEIKQQDLKETLEKVIIAIPAKDPRRFLLGAFFDIKDNILNCVATDGKLLSYVRAPITTSDETKNTAILVPQKILTEVNKNIGLEGNVKITVAEKQISFTLPNIVFVSNKINEDFPNYENLIPKKFELNVQIDKEKFLSAIDRAAIVSDESTNSICLKFDTNKLSVYVQQSNAGSENEKVPITYSNDPFGIIYNHKYLSEVLKAINNKEIVARFNGPIAPTLLQGSGDDYYLFIVMPIKIAEEDVYADDEEEDEEESKE